MAKREPRPRPKASSDEVLRKIQASLRRTAQTIDDAASEVEVDDDDQSKQLWSVSERLVGCANDVAIVLVTRRTRTKPKA